MESLFGFCVQQGGELHPAFPKASLTREPLRKCDAPAEFIIAFKQVITLDCYFRLGMSSKDILKAKQFKGSLLVRGI